MARGLRPWEGNAFAQNVAEGAVCPFATGCNPQPLGTGPAVSFFHPDQSVVRPARIWSDPGKCLVSGWARSAGGMDFAVAGRNIADGVVAHGGSDNTNLTALINGPAHSARSCARGSDRPTPA